VTGASRGIGAAVSRALVTHGARVALVARHSADLTALEAELGPAGVAVAHDLTEHVAAAALAGRLTVALGGAPTILVNNAGEFHLASLADETLSGFASAVALNLTAPFALLQAVLPAMRAAGVGHVVTIGSVADRAAWPTNGAYASTKHGARALHEVLRAETAGSGIRATLVSPGPTDTPLWDPLAPDARADLPSRSAMLQPADVAAAVVYALTQPRTVNVDELRLSHS
jgi:NADP-dependent 3-hydroxy acid dehydrogenase YdfG